MTSTAPSKIGHGSAALSLTTTATAASTPGKYTAKVVYPSIAPVWPRPDPEPPVTASNRCIPSSSSNTSVRVSADRMVAESKYTLSQLTTSAPDATIEPAVHGPDG